MRAKPQPRPQARKVPVGAERKSAVTRDMADIPTAPDVPVMTEEERERASAETFTGEGVMEQMGVVDESPHPKRKLDGVPGNPRDIFLDAFLAALVLRAHVSMGGDVTDGNYAARRLNENDVQLSIPLPEGGHRREVCRIPETFKFLAYRAV